MVAQARLAAGAVGRAPVVLVHEPVVPELLEDPPARLDVVVVVRDVRVLHVRPEGDPLRQLLEVAHVAIHALAALLVEPGDAVRLDLGLRVQPQLLLHLDLDRQAVRVPARLAGHAVAPHRLVAREQVLDDARHDVVHAGTPVRRRRPLVEHEQVLLGPFLDAAPEDVVLAPELEDARLELGEADAGVDGSEELGHFRPPGRELPGRVRKSPPRSGTGSKPAVPPCFPHEAGALRSAITLPPSVTGGGPPGRTRSVRVYWPAAPAFGRKLGRDVHVRLQRPLAPNGAR